MVHVDKREAASLTTNDCENYKQRLEFLIKREIIAKHYWAKLGIKKPFPKQQAIIDAWLNGAQYIHLNAGRRSSKTLLGSMFIIPEMSFAPFGNLPQRLASVSYTHLTLPTILLV